MLSACAHAALNACCDVSALPRPLQSVGGAYYQHWNSIQKTPHGAWDFDPVWRARAHTHAQTRARAHT